MTVELVQCCDCGKRLVSHGPAPERPICMHCDLIRHAPVDRREALRQALAPIEEPEPAEAPPAT